MADGVNRDFDKLLTGPLPVYGFDFRAEIGRLEKAAYFAYYGFHVGGPDKPVAWERLPEAERQKWRQAADAATLAMAVPEGTVRAVLGVPTAPPRLDAATIVADEPLEVDRGPTQTT